MWICMWHSAREVGVLVLNMLICLCSTVPYRDVNWSPRVSSVVLVQCSTEVVSSVYLLRLGGALCFLSYSSFSSGVSVFNANLDLLALSCISLCLTHPLSPQRLCGFSFQLTKIRVNPSLAFFKACCMTHVYAKAVMDLSSDRRAQKHLCL